MEKERSPGSPDPWPGMRNAERNGFPGPAESADFFLGARGAEPLRYESKVKALRTPAARLFIARSKSLKIWLGARHQASQLAEKSSALLTNTLATSASPIRFTCKHASNS